jgi:hypothetical protein
MKKLKLKALEFGATETLTREQMKNVLGGNSPITTGGPCQENICYDDTDCKDPKYPICNNPCGGTGWPLHCSAA